MFLYSEIISKNEMKQWEVSSSGIISTSMKSSLYSQHKLLILELKNQLQGRVDSGSPHRSATTCE